MTLNTKKIAALIIMGIIFAIIGWELPLSTTTGVQWVVNNTNLAPDAGAPHPPGTGERVSGVTYWANNSPIQIFVYAHASTVADTAEIHLSINGTIVADTSGRPIGGAESSNKTIIATIPQYANYSVEFLNFHHYEWREYQILTGDVTTNITTTSTGTVAGCEGNCSFDGIWVNSIRKNNTSDDYGTFINLSSPLKKKSSVFPGMESLLFFNDGEYFLLESTNTTTGVLSRVEGTPEHLTLEATDGSTTNMRLNYNNITTNIDTRTYIQNESELSLGGANLTNCTNCWNKSGDNMSGSIDFGRKILQNISEVNFFSYNYTSNLIGRYSAISFPYNQSGTTPPTFNFYFRTVSRTWNTSINDFSNASNPDITGSYDSLGNGNFQVGSFAPNSTTKHLDFEVSATNSSSTVKDMVKIYTPLNLTISAMSGVGNAYVCVDSTGKLYRGSPGC